MASQASDPLTQNPSLADVVHPDFHQVNSTVELYIKNQLGLKLDTDEQICRLALTTAGCPLGPRHCPMVLPGTRFVIDLPPSASIGCADFVKREMDASFCMNTTYDVCQNVGGSLGMEHARLVTNAYTHIQRNEKSSVLTTNEAFDRIVLENMSGVLRVILFLAPAKALSTQMKRHSPKPGIPPPEAYRPPSPPSQRDLGPPPPGWGRFTEHGAGPNGPGGSFVVGQNNTGFVPRRNLDDVLCFKCGQKGHYANTCRNKNVPGNRGGQERGTYRPYSNDDSNE
ncbi:Zinc finger C-x8-C-x5-C-x3-H type (and similar), partial [Rhizoctonia solani]